MQKRNRRQLLEAAARVAGLVDHRYQVGLGLMAKYTPQDGFFGAWWSSLDRGDDAIWLAAKLHINLEHVRTQGGALLGVNCWPCGRFDCAAQVIDPADPQAAIRLAITTAAALLEPASAADNPGD